MRKWSDHLVSDKVVILVPGGGIKDVTYTSVPRGAVICDQGGRPLRRPRGRSYRRG